MLRSFYYILPMILLAGCVSYEQLGLSRELWNDMDSKAREKVLNDYKNAKQQQSRTSTPVVNSSSSLSVSLIRGEAMMPPFTHSYDVETTKFKIEPGVCKSIELHSKSHDNQITMRACYNGERLSLDPSRYEKKKLNGSIHFDYNPIWQRGFTYEPVNSSGYVRLRNASISIKAVYPNE